MLNAFKKLFLKRLTAPRGSLSPTLHKFPQSQPKSTGKRVVEKPAFLHPQGNARVTLKNCRITYELQRKRRKSIGVYVDAQGVTVRAPRWVKHGDIELFLHEKSDWIFKKLCEQKDKQEQEQKMRTRWVDGGVLNYLGQKLTLRIMGKPVGEKSCGASDVFLNAHTLTLEVHILENAQDRELAVSELVQTWMQEQALTYFQQRCFYYAQLIKVKPQHIALTSAKTRWGSANTQGVIRLHWRLMEFPLGIVDYVIVHELAHLKEMNHSPRFWRIVEAALPDYEQRRALLKQQTPAAWS